MTKKLCAAILAALLVASGFAGTAAAEDGDGESPSECGTGDTNNPCAGDGTSLQDDVASSPTLPKSGV